jgi:hypothetical protein
LAPVARRPGSSFRRRRAADKHFLTLHSWFGGVALLLVALSVLGGAFKSLSVGGLLWVDEVHRQVCRLCRRGLSSVSLACPVQSGYFTFILLVVSCILGLFNKVSLLPPFSLVHSLARPGLQVVLFPKGFSGPFVVPSVSELAKPGGTWSYSVRSSQLLASANAESRC